MKRIGDAEIPRLIPKLMGSFEMNLVANRGRGADSRRKSSPSASKVDSKALHIVGYVPIVYDILG